MSQQRLVLSLFPGIGLLDMAFEAEGFCVVRGPDLLWGGDVFRFHPPDRRFDGVIGGPPCKGESKMAYLNGEPGRSLAAEFMRVVDEARPTWWVMEAVRVSQLALFRSGVPALILQNRWFGERQSRRRFFHSNLALRRFIQGEALMHIDRKHAVLAGHAGAVGAVSRGIAKYSLGDACELQGLPRDFADRLPFRRDMKYEVIGNGVPLAMGRAVARAVRLCIEEERAWCAPKEEAQ